MDAKTNGDKKARVLTCAEMVFLQQGYARTTMGALATAAGMSRPALYLIYPRKHEVFSSIIDEEEQFEAHRSLRSETDSLQHWLVWVCNLWLGEQQNLLEKQDTKYHSRSEYLSREADFLEKTLEAGLERRMKSLIPDETRASVARALTFCVCGLVGSDLSVEARRDLLSFQVEALALAIARTPPSAKQRSVELTNTVKNVPATGRAAAWR